MAKGDSLGNVKDLRTGLDRALSASKSLSKAIDTAASSTEKLSGKMLTSGKGVELFSEAVTGLSSSTIKGASSAVKLFGAMSQITSGSSSSSAAVRSVSSGFSSLTGSMAAVTTAAGLAMDVLKGTAKVTDGATSGARTLISANYDLASSFGKTMTQAKAFSKGFGKISADMSNLDMGSFSPPELMKVSAAMAGVNLGFKIQTEGITVGTKRLTALGAAALQSEASGVSATKYYKLLGSAIRTQGLDTKSAMEQIALYKNVASETGLTVGDVASNMNQFGESFSLLGVSASFGEPAIKSFSRTVSDMGLGIENATKLSSNFNKSLIGITTNYATASITSQRGGMGYGGGALNSSIQMQAKMLNAKKSGDTGAQEKLNLELMEGMKKTIESFAGGSIVTVNDAAKDESLQGSYFAQKEQLKSLYGITEENANATLEMFKGYSDAVKEGDKDKAKMFTEQFNDARDKRSESLGLMDKSNALVAGIFAEIVSNKMDLAVDVNKTSGELSQGLFSSIRDAIQSDNAEELSDKINKALINGVKNAGGLLGAESSETGEEATVLSELKVLIGILKSKAESRVPLISAEGAVSGK